MEGRRIVGGRDGGSEAVIAGNGLRRGASAARPKPERSQLNTVQQRSQIQHAEPQNDR
jgi:hypothetical protein